MKTYAFVLAAGTIATIVACSEETNSCFLAGTMIATPEGDVAIEDLKEGDAVWAFRTDGTLVVRNVVACLKRTSTHVRTLRTTSLTIETTDEHPFWQPETRSWVQAGTLKEGSVLVFRNADGTTRPETVVSSMRQERTATVYNLSVEGPEHSYFAQGIAVHNKFPDCEFCRDPRDDAGQIRGDAATGNAKDASEPLDGSDSVDASDASDSMDTGSD